jgi:hypothetical protein
MINAATSLAITANLEALRIRLERAAALSGEARLAMAQNKPNLAIGTVLEFEQSLPECVALFQAILALHRTASREAQS